MPSAVKAAYDKRVALGSIRPDAAQAQALEALVRLEGDLAGATQAFLRSRELDFEFAPPPFGRAPYTRSPADSAAAASGPSTG